MLQHCLARILLDVNPSAHQRRLGNVLMGFARAGFGQMLARPLFRERHRPDMSEEEATQLLHDALRVRIPRCPRRADLRAKCLPCQIRCGIGPADTAACTAGVLLPRQADHQQVPDCQGHWRGRDRIGAVRAGNAVGLPGALLQRLEPMLLDASHSVMQHCNAHRCSCCARCRRSSIPPPMQWEPGDDGDPTPPMPAALFLKSCGHPARLEHFHAGAFVKVTVLSHCQAHQRTFTVGIYSIQT